MSDTRKIQQAKMDNLMDRWMAASRADYIANYGDKYPESAAKASATRYTTGAKMFHLVIDSSSAFLVDIETGTIYGNKGWLKVDRQKIVGNAYDPNFDAAVLVRDRFRYGHFENNSDGSLREPIVRR